MNVFTSGSEQPHDQSGWSTPKQSIPISQDEVALITRLHFSQSNAVGGSSHINTNDVAEALRITEAEVIALLHQIRNSPNKAHLDPKFDPIEAKRRDTKFMVITVSIVAFFVLFFVARAISRSDSQGPIEVASMTGPVPAVAPMARMAPMAPPELAAMRAESATFPAEFKASRYQFGTQSQQDVNIRSLVDGIGKTSTSADFTRKLIELAEKSVAERGKGQLHSSNAQEIQRTLELVQTGSWDAPNIDHPQFNVYGTDKNGVEMSLTRLTLPEHTGGSAEVEALCRAERARRIAEVAAKIVNSLNESGGK